MSNPDYTRIWTQSGAVKAVVGDQLKVRSTVDFNYQSDGRMRPEVAQLLKTPNEYSWGITGAFSPGTINQRFRLSRPGALMRVSAMVTTAPIGSSCTVTVTQQSATTGIAAVATVQIQPGKFYGESVIENVTLPAGTWLGARIDAASNAAGISITAEYVGGA